MLSAIDDGIVVVEMERSTGMAAPRLMTADEYFRTPETVLPAELAHGVLRVAESPSPRHQSAVLRLLRALDEHVRGRDLGELWVAPLDVVLDRATALIVQPDLFFISKDRAWIVQERVHGAPDLAIEVLSPNPRIGKTEERLGWFAEYGVRECWLVHLDRRELTVVEFGKRRIRERRISGRRDPIRSTVLPDFGSTFDEIMTD